MIYFDGVALSQAWGEPQWVKSGTSHLLQAPSAKPAPTTSSNPTAAVIHARPGILRCTILPITRPTRALHSVVQDTRPGYPAPPMCLRRGSRG